MVFKYDLHNHSNRSFDCGVDGKELISLAKNRGVKGIGICDHDNFPNQSLEEQAKAEGIDVVLGIEFSCIDAHIIGYNLQLRKRDKDYLKQKFKDFYRAHTEHGRSLISQLKEKKWDIDEIDIMSFSGKPFVTAIDIFRYFADVKKLYSRWQETRRDFRQKKMFSLTKKEVDHFDPYEIIQLIKRSNGVAVWAHPLFSRTNNHKYFNSFEPEDVFIEVSYPYLENGIEYGTSNEELQKIVKDRCIEKGFRMSGGSDSHYPIKVFNSGVPIFPGDFGLDKEDEPIIQQLFC